MKKKLENRRVIRFPDAPSAVQTKKALQANSVRLFYGALARTRTLDPLIKSQLLYQLSYECRTYFAGAAGCCTGAAGAGMLPVGSDCGRLPAGSDAGAFFCRILVPVPSC